MGESGDPRKQQRPDGRVPGAEVTSAFPPSFSGVVTEFGCEVVPFPFPGNSGVQMKASCGPLTLNLILDPAFADKVCELILEAAAEAKSGLRPATIGEVNALANGAKAG